MPRMSVNGTELHYEIRGAGAPVLLIMERPGTVATLTRSPELLCDEFTVVTYDRRGNVTSSPTEQRSGAAGSWR